MFLVSFIFGLIIVISSIFLIRQELNRAVRNQKMILEQSKVYKDEDLFALLESLQLSVDEMNRAFYEIAADLEGKYSIHEKEIQLLDEKLSALNSKKSQTFTKTTIQSMQQKKESASDIGPVDLDINTQHPVNEAVMIDKIIAMRSEGKPLSQIAKELGIGMGELQLLLSLKK